MDNIRIAGNILPVQRQNPPSTPIVAFEDPIEAATAKSAVSAKSLTLDLLSTCGKGAAPVRALIEAAALFDIADNALRVALARLRADGLVVSDERGRYRLGPSAIGVNRQIVGWRTIDRRVRPWSGDWIGVHSGSSAAGGQRSRKRTRADLKRRQPLRLLGFRTLAPGLDVRPDNLAGGVAFVAQRLAQLGLETSGAVEPQTTVFGMTSVAPETDATARKLWDTDRLRSDHVELTERLERSAARLPTLPRAIAMRESFELGGEGIRQLVVDPLLPESIAPADERRALLDAMLRYDRLGRECWANWLGGEAAPVELPAGVRAAGIRATGVGGLDPMSRDDMAR